MTGRNPAEDQKVILWNNFNYFSSRVQINNKILSYTDAKCLPNKPC